MSPPQAHPGRGQEPLPCAPCFSFLRLKTRLDTVHQHRGEGGRRGRRSQFVGSLELEQTEAGGVLKPARNWRDGSWVAP